MDRSKKLKSKAESIDERAQRIRSALTHLSESGFDKASIMQYAHRAASSQSSYSSRSYRYFLSRSLKNVWEHAHENVLIVKRHGGYEKAKAKADRLERRAEELYDQAESLKKAEARGKKKRKLILASEKTKAQKLLADDEFFDGYGKDWRAGNDIAARFGSHWLGSEGRKVCYMYYYEMPTQHETLGEAVTATNDALPY